VLMHAKVTDDAIGAAIEVHKHLGPGLLEHVYEECLCHELGARGIACEHQVKLPVTYKGLQIECAYRMDVVVEDLVAIEVNSVEITLPVHEAQLLTYLRLSKKRVGLLINFNVALLKNGIIRKVL
jgi:GxxExxY protein